MPGPHTPSEELASPTSPEPGLLTGVEAYAQRVERLQRHASDCIALALVTGPEISAEMIDAAIELKQGIQDNGR